MEFKTKSDYDYVIEEIKKLVLLYESNYNRDNRYKLFLSSGKNITYTITDNNIAHLLGVNIDSIRNKYCPKASSIEALKYLVDNSYSIYKNIQIKEIGYGNLFSTYIQDKLQIFEQQLNLMSDIEEIEFVCEFDSSKCYMDGGLIEYNADYYIAKKIKNGDLILLGLIKKGNSIFYPQTSQLIKKEDLINYNISETRLGKLLKNQIISFVGSIRAECERANYRRDIHLNISPKANALQKLNFYSLKYGAVPCTHYYHMFDLKCVNGSREEIIKTKTDLLQLSEFMKEKEIIDISQFDEPLPEIIDLINTYNDIITQENYSKKASLTYSNLINEYNQLKINVATLQEEKESLKREKLELLKQQQCSEIVKQNYENLKNSLFDLAEKEKQKTL